MATQRPSVPTSPRSDDSDSSHTTAVPTSDDQHDVEAAAAAMADTGKQAAQLDWAKSPENSMNWPAWQKMYLVASISLASLVASIGTSIISPATFALQREFGVGSVVSLLPLSLYVFALAFGPVVGGPFSETFGRKPVYVTTTLVGAIFTVGCAVTHNFAALCVLRFLAGFAWGPSLAIGSGTLAETFQPKRRGPAMATFILMPFLGPGLGPIIGSFATSRQSWRWTQWILVIMAGAAVLVAFFTKETYPAAIKRRLAKKSGQPLPKSTHSTLALAKNFLTIGLFRPIRMTTTDPFIFLRNLYVSINFGVLFSFFAAVPYTFINIYRFSLEQSGLVFVAVIIGCVLGLMTTMICDKRFYQSQIPNYPPHKVPPEFRLYSAVLACVGPPIGLFWYAWTARSSVSWASPAAAIVPFAWGNLITFIAMSSYSADIYKGHLVASAASSNSLMRYAFAGSFPLFITHRAYCYSYWTAVMRRREC